MSPSERQRYKQLANDPIIATGDLIMTEQETMAQQIAGERYALVIDDTNGRRQYEKGRLFPNERKAFDAGWEAAKEYYGVSNVPTK